MESRASLLPQQLCQLFQKCDLGGVDFLFGFCHAEEAGAVDFRDGFEFSRVRWPFHLEIIAPNARRVAFAFKGPRMNNLTAFLGDGVEFDESAIRFEADFLFEFALGGEERFFARLDFAFGNGPCARVAVFPEGSARMREQKFELTIA